MPAGCDSALPPPLCACISRSSSSTRPTCASGHVPVTQEHKEFSCESASASQVLTNCAHCHPLPLSGIVLAETLVMHSRYRAAEAPSTVRHS